MRLGGENKGERVKRRQRGGRRSAELHQRSGGIAAEGRRRRGRGVLVSAGVRGCLLLRLLLRLLHLLLHLLHLLLRLL